MGLNSLLSCVLLLAAVLAGCSGGGTPEEQQAEQLAEGAPEVEVTQTTGGLRGVVVDEAVRPISGAKVEVLSTDKAMTTDASGLFSFSGLDAGTYFVKASHPLYDVAQQSVDVVAGVPDPQPVKFLLSRVIFSQPYLTTEKFDGYIVCSAGHPEVGYSEECGEGVGVPGVGRVGGQGNNQVQYDFYVDNMEVRSILAELVWEPTAQTHASGELLTYMSTQWVCDPFCGGNVFANGGSASPLILRAEAENGTIGGEEFTTDEPFTIFTWANPDTYDPATGTVPLGSVMLNQPYQAFITKSYHLPLPVDYSFVLGSPNPF